MKLATAAADLTPYCRFLLHVQCAGPSKKTSSYGIAKQSVFDASQVVITDLFAIRGWNFSDQVEKKLDLRTVSAHRLHAPAVSVQFDESLRGLSGDPAVAAGEFIVEKLKFYNEFRNSSAAAELFLSSL